MKIKVSDYIADFCEDKGINYVFSVVGGGAMHMNDSFGHHAFLNTIYHHHEQAAAIAAEAYARVNNEMAALCVTSGPGAINALNGVVGAYQDSIPMLVFSGQTKTTLTVKNSGLKLRTLGNQEFDIVSALENVVKYSEMLMDAKRIRYCLEKAYHIAITGRPGPCWLDIPLDIQGSYVDIEELIGYEPSKNINSNGSLEKSIHTILEKLKIAQRPVLYAGNGIRISGGVEIFNKLINLLQIPVVTCWDSIDLIDNEHSLYCGRAGIMGDRAGNFAVQNSDLLLCIGSRLNIYQVGYNVKTWAREAYVIDVDIDEEELKKKTIRVDLPVCADAKEFMKTLYQEVKCVDINNYYNWCKQCQIWKNKYPVVTKKQYEAQGLVNIYNFIGKLGHLSPANTVTVVSNGSACVVGSQASFIKKNDRFIMNCALSSMGYGLPAAIGVCVANNKQETVCVEGDGSLMMNLQEIQTVVTNKLPIKLFVINNNGYHQIRQTQTNVFGNKLIGVGPESGDLGFPNFQMLARAFGIRYVCIDDNQKITEGLEDVFSYDEPVFCELIVSIDQKFEPKSATKRLEDGTLYSPPLEDLAPFLPREELENNMYISMIEEI